MLTVPRIKPVSHANVAVSIEIKGRVHFVFTGSGFDSRFGVMTTWFEDRMGHKKCLSKSE